MLLHNLEAWADVLVWVWPGYDPKTSHMVVGQDADLMLLALLTHEPRIAILREAAAMELGIEDTGGDDDAWSPVCLFAETFVDSDNMTGTPPLYVPSIYSYVYSPFRQHK